MSLPSQAFSQRTFPLVKTGSDFINKLGENCILKVLGSSTFDQATQTVVQSSSSISTKGFRSQPSKFETQEAPFIGKHTEVVFLLGSLDPKPGDVIEFSNTSLTIKRIRAMRYSQGIVAYRVLAVQQ